MPSEPQLQDYFEYLRFPSVSAAPDQRPSMQACADWLVGKFRKMGFGACAHSTGGNPVVLARRSSPLAGAQTLLIYGHYDVQPAEPLGLWRHPPFEPEIRDGFAFARGATDNKGQTMAHILGTEAWLAGGRDLPVNLIYLIEGDEEIGSPHLGAFLTARAAELACDGIIVSDTSMIGPGRPAITNGLRGIACVDLTVRGPATDIHSGVFGGAVANPATELARLLGGMHAPSGEVAIPGFYDAVAPASAAERQAWREIGTLDAGLLRASGAAALAGEDGYSGIERTWIRPTAEVNGIIAGYQGPGSKTIIPAMASAKLSFRLVPDQDPADIALKVKRFFAARASPAVEIAVDYDHGGRPYHANPDTPLARAVRAALQAVFGREAVLVREGLSIPIVSTFKEVLGRDTLLVGLGLPDCGAHGPNESFPLDHLDRGIELHQEILRRLIP